MRLSEAIEELASGRMARAGERVLCAVSGGADSVALLAILSEAAPRAGFELRAAHVHHGIRSESDEELEFVSGLCARLGAPLDVLRADVPALAAAAGESVESAARRVRYDFFYKVARERRCDMIALAHHSRDQAETVLMHALRGASVSGLCAMRPRAGMLVRPLLYVDPEELRAYLEERGLEFREDRTNADIRYTRNFVRHVILPECERVYPGSRAGLCRLAQAAALDDDYLSAQAERAAGECLHEYPGGAYLCVEPMRALHPALRARVAARAMRDTGQDAGSAGIERILAALDGAASNLPGDVRISRGAQRIYLEYPRPGRGRRTAGALEGCADVDAESLPARVELDGGALLIDRPGRGPDGGLELGDGRWEQTVDAAALCGAQLRYRRAGDVIWPLGAPGPKKLKDFYIDRKVDRQVRGFLPVLARGSEVLWALGVGVARSCAVTGDTQSALMLRWEGARLW